MIPVFQLIVLLEPLEQGFSHFSVYSVSVLLGTGELLGRSHHRRRVEPGVLHSNAFLMALILLAHDNQLTEAVLLPQYSCERGSRGT